MAENKTRGNPATDRLREELEKYIEVRIDHALTGAGRRMTQAASGKPLVRGGEKLGHLGHAVGDLGHKVSPGKALPALAERASHVRDRVSHVTDRVPHVTDAAHKAMEAGKPSGGARTLTIIEDIDVGVPVSEAYDQWTQFQDFGEFAKGVVKVEQKDDATTDWRVKVGKAKRAWRGKITEQVPDERIAWTSEGDKATTRGVVTFHDLGDNLTKVLVVLEYSPKGVVERSGALFRAQGRRVRLDLKLFRKFLMLRGEATGSWRGEIREGDVVHEDEDRISAEEEEEEDEAEEPYEDEESYVEEDEEEDEEEEPAAEERPRRRTASSR